MINHSERISIVETEVKHINGRLDDLTMSVTGLTAQIAELKVTMEKYKWFLLALAGLMALDNKYMQKIIEHFLPFLA